MNVFDILREKLDEMNRIFTTTEMGADCVGRGCCKSKECPECVLIHVNEIVNQVEQEYNNGWIPCSSGLLPEEHDSIFAKWKNTERWKHGMFEKISNEVNVTIVSENGDRVTDNAHTIDGKWSCDLLRCNKQYRVIAWRPLPEPYSGAE